MINFISEKTNTSIEALEEYFENYPIEEQDRKEVDQVLEILISAELIMQDTIDTNKATATSKVAIMAGLYDYLADKDDVVWDSELVMELSGLFI